MFWMSWNQGNFLKMWCMQAMDIFHTGLALPNGRALLLKAEMEAPLKFL